MQSYARKSLQFLGLLALYFVLIVHFQSHVSAALQFGNIATLNGDNSTAMFGGTRHMFGDLNNDGHPDFIEAAMNYNTYRGKLYVYFGGPLFDSTYDFSITGENDNDFLGHGDLSHTIADFNNDGKSDFITGSFNYLNGSRIGKTYVFYGKESLSGNVGAETADYSLTGNTTDQKGLSAIAIGDFNGDGRKDLVHNALYATTGSSVSIYYGQADGGYSTVPDTTMVSTNGFFGTTLTVVNMNNDNYDDLAVTYYYANPTVGGVTNVYFGGSIIDNVPDISFTPENPADWYNRNSTVFQDINNDNKTDFCVGANRNNTNGTRTGRVYCYINSDSLRGVIPATSANFIASGRAPNDNYGRSVSTYDLNNDGKRDLIVGAYQTDGSKNGYVDIYINTRAIVPFNDTPSITLNAIDYGESGHMFGTSVSAADINGNGWPEIFVSSINVTDTTGIVRVLEITHGTPTIITNSPQQTNSRIVSGTASDSTTSFLIHDVQWSLTNTPTGDWHSCTAVDGSFDEAIEPFTCNISSLTEGTTTVYFRTVDQDNLFMPKELYQHSTITIDTTSPTAPIITDIGKITNLKDKSSLYVYFTSQTPLIKGKAEPNSTVYFTTAGYAYHTITNSKGLFEIQLQSPNLARGINAIEYYAVDKASNMSLKKSLTMVIGEENFPQNTHESAIEVTPSPTTTPIPTLTPEQTPIAGPNLISIKVVDNNGNTVSGAYVFINNKQYKTNTEGRIEVESVIPKGTPVEVEFAGIRYSTIINENTIRITISSKKHSFSYIWLLILLLIIIALLAYAEQKKRHAKKQ